jgi:transcriptional repressor NrdR
MKCPFCQSPQLKVVDKRDSNEFIRRRRECLKCAKRFTTYEKIEDIPLHVLKKNGKKVLFDRSKVRSGLSKACQKRPVTLEQIETSVRKIESKLRNRKSDITTKVIGEEVIRELKKIDKVAYIRFASVYQEFEDLEDFSEAINKII